MKYSNFRTPGEGKMFLVILTCLSLFSSYERQHSSFEVPFFGVRFGVIDLSSDPESADFSICGNLVSVLGMDVAVTVIS